MSNQKDLVFEQVLVNKTKRITCMVDCGAAVSVCTPGLVSEMGLILLPPRARIAMANGAPTKTLGSVFMTVTASNGKAAEGFVAVMDLPKLPNLLLGNDFLEQFKKVTIDYTDEGPVLTLGAMMADDDVCAHNKVLVLESILIPPRSILSVKVSAGIGPADRNSGKVWVTIPFNQLLEKRGLSSGYAVVSEANSVVMMINISEKSSWLQRGTAIGRVEEVNCVMDFDEEKPLPERVVALLSRETSLAKISLKPTEEVEEPTEEKLDFLSQISKDLSETEKQMVLSVLEEYSSCFRGKTGQIGRCNMSLHHIDTGSARPIYRAPKPCGPLELQEIRKQVDEMTRQKIIQPSKSPWGSRVVLARKPDGSWRFCADLRDVNAVTKKDVYPLPNISTVLASLDGAKYFTNIDLQAGFHQLELTPDSKEKTAFITPDGLWEYNVLPFGAVSASANFQRTMDLILAGLSWVVCLVYLDDVITHARTLDEHLRRLCMVLERIQSAGLTIKLSKCHFAEKELRILGHIVNSLGVSADPEKTKAVVAFPSPPEGAKPKELIKWVQSFTSMVGYYRRHIDNFAMMARPLTMLTRKDAVLTWGTAQEEAVSALKNALLKAATLAHPRYDGSPMEVYPDACMYGIGAVLAQRIEGEERPLAYASRLLSKAECNYTISEKECLGLVWALQKFRMFIWGLPVVAWTDHQALTWLLTKKDLAGRLARWSLHLMDFDLTIKYRSGKLQTHADALSRYPVDKPETEEIDEGRFLSLAALTADDAHLELDSKDAHIELLWAEKTDYFQKLRAGQMLNSTWRYAFECCENGGQLGNFVIQDGLLYLQSTKFGETFQRLCVPEFARHKILRTFHNQTDSAHLGVNKTTNKITKRYTWPKMHHDIRKYVLSCGDCQSRKGLTTAKAGFLQCVKVERPFEKVGIDLCGPFPESNSGNRHIIVAVCYLTKWVETRAVPSQKAEDVVKFFIEQIYCRHGAPEGIASDQGKGLISSLTKSVMDALETNHYTTTAYRAAGNGMVERQMHVFADMLSMFVGKDQKDWDENLHLVTFAFNTSVQESTGFEPFYLLYGRRPRLPIDFEMASSADALVPKEKAGMKYHERLIEDLANARLLVQTRMEQVRQKSKARYDATRIEKKFKKGDLVLLYKPFRKVGAVEKYLHRWLGPYVVENVLSDVNYEVKLASNSKKKSEIAHVERLKKFHVVIKEMEAIQLPASPERNSSTDVEPQPISIPDLIKKRGRPKKTVVVKENVEISSKAEAIVPEVERNKNGRPQRERRQPDRLRVCLLFSFLIMMLCIIGGGAEKIESRGSVIFKEEAKVAFSESAWTIVTTIPTVQLKAHSRHLSSWLKEQVELIESPLNSMKSSHKEIKSFTQLTKFFHTKASMCVADLDEVTRRFDSNMLVLAHVRNRRGVFDGVGTGLKWLFGVSTTSDLEQINSQVANLQNNQEEMTHIMQHQASIANETLWEVKQTAGELLKLKISYMDFGKKVKVMFETMEAFFNASDHSLAMFIEGQLLYYHIENEIKHWHQSVINLELGLNDLANGRLPQSLFRPQQMRNVLDKLERRLPPGWALTHFDTGSDSLWEAYREADVATAVINGELKAFIRLPIYETLSSFTLYKVVSLAVPTTDGKGATRVSSLPPFIALSKDTFVELLAEEASECVRSRVASCRFHTAIGKANTQNSCAWATFTENVEDSKRSCKTKFSSWMGTQTVYLGQRLWAISALEAQSLVVSCPNNERQVIKVPALGIFEVPLSCSARSKEWIFPASIEGKTDVDLNLTQRKLPPLKVLHQYETITGQERVSKMETEATPELDQMSEILRRNDLATSENEITSDQVKRLIEKEYANSGYKHLYPFEWIFVSLAIICFVGWRWRQARIVKNRLRAHELLVVDIEDAADEANAADQQAAGPINAGPAAGM